MATIYPKALKTGDEVRVIAPARSLALISPGCRDVAKERFQNELGLKLSFGKHVEEKDSYASSSIKSRVEDLHEAFADKKVKAILTSIGGFNSEEMIGSINWGLIKSNPKIFCGFSDITTLSNAIYAKTGVVAFVGPHYSSFGMKRGFEYTMEQFKKAVMGSHRQQVLPAANWSNDAWFMEQEKREFISNAGMRVFNPGKAKGPIVGGNLSSLVQLSRDYLPKLEGSILFLEECHDCEIDKALLMRSFGMLVRTPGFDKIKGLVFGRFEKATKWNDEDMKELIARRPELAKRNIPIITGADFGHTTPIFTFGVGGTAEIHADQNGAQLFFEPFVKE